MLLDVGVFSTGMDSPVKADWFGNKEQERQLKEAQQQLESQRKQTGGWVIVAGAFAVGCVLLFTIGTAIGSHVRRHENKK